MVFWFGANNNRGINFIFIKVIYERTNFFFNNYLSSKFKPIVKAALLKVEITKYWNPLASKYNKLPLVQKVNPNLEDYVTQKTLDGLFLLLADEELKIRKDPVARVSDILKKVFSSL